MGEMRGIDRKKVGCRSLIDANLEGQVGVNKFKLYYNGICVHANASPCKNIQVSPLIPRWTEAIESDDFG